MSQLLHRLRPTTRALNAHRLLTRHGPYTPFGSLLEPAAAPSGVCRFDKLGGIRDERSYAELPNVLWAPHKEFPHLSTDFKWDRASTKIVRFTRLSRTTLLDLSSTLPLLCTSVVSIFGIGIAEAYSVLAADAWGAHPFEASLFITRYSWEQVIQSCVWLTQDARTIALAMGIDPHAILNVSIANGTPPVTSADAAALMRVQGLCAVRSIIATTFFLSQVQIRTDLLQLPPIATDDHLACHSNARSRRCCAPWASQCAPQTRTRTACGRARSQCSPVWSSA